ncbi:MAG: SLC13 family permease [Chloroflexi bacterium]|nr:SLC13 family permease [Chloroflexota bacterium]
MPESAPTGRWPSAAPALTVRDGLALAAALAAGILGPFSPWPVELAPAGRAALAVTAAVVILWGSGAVPSAVAALLAVVLLTTSGAAPLAGALGGFSAPIVFFLLGVLGLGVAAVESGLGRRLAALLLARAAGHPRRLYTDMLVGFALLAFIVPSATTRGGVLLPVYEEALRLLNAPPHSPLAKAVMQGLSAVNRLGSTAILTGGITPITAAGLIGGFTWGRWFLIAAPPVYLIMILGGLAIALIYRPHITVTDGSLPKPLPWTPREVRALVITVAVAALWITESLHHLDPAIPALVGLVVACLPGVGVVRWNAVERDLGWPNVLVIGAALSVAKALNQSGAAAWLAVGARGLLNVVPASPWATVLMLVVVSFLVRIVLPNIASYLTLMVPLSMALAAELGLNPLVCAMLVTVAGDSVLYFPAQSASSLMVAERGHLSPGDVLLFGLVMSLVTAGVLLGFAIPYWSWLGEPLIMAGR